MKTKSLVCFACLVLLLLTTPSTVWAQSLAGGAIEGTVTDATGAVLPGATVTVLNSATGAKQETTSKSDGLFQFPVLTAGKYTLSVSKAGFATVQNSEVSLPVGGKLNIPVSLPVASKGETVNVSSEIPVIETTRTQVSSNVNERSIRDLPVNGRNFIDFVLLTPGVTRDVRTGDLSFAGQRGTLNSLTVDGSDDNNSFFGQTTGRTGSGRAPYQFSQDAVQEFQVNTNSYSAELGRAGGAVVNVITKSGTNAFHGAAFEFYRDQSLNANDPIAKLNNALRNAPPPAKSKYHFNQFGGDVGGPIVKDKLFFFFDYDGQRNHQPNVVTYTPPVIASPTANQTTALDYLAGLANSYTRGLNQDTYLTKVDWNAGKNQISGRWNRQLFTGSDFENGGPVNSEQHTGDSNVHTDTITGSVTTTLNNSTINQFRVTFLRDSEPGLANSDLPEAVVREAGNTLLTVGRNSFSPRETTIKHWQYADNITWVRGRHTLKFGADMVQDKILNFFPGNFSGAYTFNSLEDFGASLNGTNNPGVSFSQAFAGAGTTGPTTHPDILQWAGFVQDDWRVNNKLTLNLGLRYDEQRIKQPTVQNPVAMAAGFNTALIPVDRNNFGPRLGFAYAVSDKLVVRGGYGVFYGSTPSIMIGTAMSNNGINVGTLTFKGTDAPTYPNTQCGAPVPSPSCSAPSGGTAGVPSIYVFSKDFKNPLVNQANLGVEYGIGKDWSVSLGYIYVGGSDLQRTRDVNLAPPTPATIGLAGTTDTLSYLKYSSVRPVAGFSRIAQFESTASSNYNGMTLEVKKRFAQNYQMAISYTWSHVLDNAPDATSVVPFSSGDDAKMVADPLSPFLDYASGVNDMRHRFVVSGVWDLNAYTGNMNRIAKGVLGGWELSSIFTAQSGQPYSALLGSDLNNDSNRQTDRTPGVGRDTFNLPATYSLDPRITRTVKITEGTKLQFFGEAFNLFNHFNVTSVRNQQYAVTTVPAPTPSNPNPVNPCGSNYAVGQQCLVQQNQANAPFTYFGLPNGTSGQRIVQLGAKFTF
ncbi:MAG: TonB-dependent receptor [Terriglobia bacterium]|nr:TonB-dependent receptor [Terriglobia bacterium]